MGKKYKNRQAKTEGAVRIAGFGPSVEFSAGKYYLENPEATLHFPKWKHVDEAPKNSQKYDAVFSDLWLQRVHHTLNVKTIEAWISILLPGGDLHITVPSVEWFCDQMMPPGEPSAFAYQHLFGLSRTPEEVNLTGYTMDRLSRLMEQSGLFLHYARSYNYVQTWGGQSQTAELHHCIGRKPALIKELD